MIRSFLNKDVVTNEMHKSETLFATDHTPQDTYPGIKGFYFAGFRSHSHCDRSLEATQPGCVHTLHVMHQTSEFTASI